MYQQFFGLRELPFELTPNPRFLFLSAGHKEALSNLQYAIRGRKGVVVLLGQAGTGKTTILRTFVASNPDPDTRFVFFENPRLTRREFYALTAVRLGFSAAAAASKAHFLIELETLLAPRDNGRTRVALVFDETQVMPAGVLEEVRLLSNLETETEKLLTIVLAGQPEFSARLEEPALEPLKQRISLRCELAPFDLHDTAAYISGRLWIAGGHVDDIFTSDAMVVIHQASRGIPRSVSVICDNVLVTAFAMNIKPIGPDVVRGVCRDFKLAGPVFGDGWPMVRISPGREAQQPPSPAAGPAAPDDPPEEAPRRRRFLARLAPHRREMTTLGGELRAPAVPDPPPEQPARRRRFTREVTTLGELRAAVGRTEPVTRG